MGACGGGTRRVKRVAVSRRCAWGLAAPILVVYARTGAFIIAGNPPAKRKPAPTAPLTGYGALRLRVPPCCAELAPCFCGCCRCSFCSCLGGACCVVAVFALGFVRGCPACRWLSCRRVCRLAAWCCCLLVLAACSLAALLAASLSLAAVCSPLSCRCVRWGVLAVLGARLVVLPALVAWFSACSLFLVFAVLAGSSRSGSSPSSGVVGLAVAAFPSVRSFPSGLAVVFFLPLLCSCCSSAVFGSSRLRLLLLLVFGLGAV